MMHIRDLEAVGEGRGVLTIEQRAWCIGELSGPLNAYNPLKATEGAEDAVLAECLLRAWTASIRCDCE